MYNLGKIDLYEVDRETKLGYVLVKNDEEYFLHHNECAGLKLIPGDKVKAFLYVDKKNRMALTLFKPKLEVGTISLLEVVGVNPALGIFLNIGISKDILLSCDDLPKDDKEWPKEGDLLPCEMKIRANRLNLKITNKPEIIRKCNKQSKYVKDDNVCGYVYRISPEGINLCTEEYEVVFIYKTNLRKKYRLGEKVEVRIIDVHEDDYSGTTIKNKEFQMLDDETIILDYLHKNNGVMLITDKSSPELINKLFNMSKSAFKNALGKLYKEKKIIILENKIVLSELM